MGALSSAGGGALGAILGSLTDSPGEHTGGALGGLSGVVLGKLLNTMVRRSQTKEYLKEYSDGAKVDPKQPKKLRGIGNILLPGSGAHRHGEAEAYQTLKGNKPHDNGLNTGMNWAQTIPGLPPAIPWAAGSFQNYDADNIRDGTG